jgi:hypothetical protein
VAAPRTEQLMHLVRAREEAMGELAAQDLARSQYSRDVIPSPASSFKQHRPNANVGAIERQKLANETRVVGGVLARMFPWMYQKPADEKGKTSVARMQVKQANAAQQTAQEVKKGNSILGLILKNWLSGVLLWAMLKDPLTKFYKEVVEPWWKTTDNPIVRFLDSIMKWGEKVWEWLKGDFATWIKGIWKSIKDFVSDLPKLFKELLAMIGGMWDVMKQWLSNSFLPNIKLALANLLTTFAGFLDSIFGGRSLFQVLKHAFQEGITLPFIKFLSTAEWPALRGLVNSEGGPIFKDGSQKIAEIQKQIKKEREEAKAGGGYQSWLSKQKFMDYLDPPPAPGEPRLPGQIWNQGPNWELPDFGVPPVAMPGASIEEILKRWRNDLPSNPLSTFPKFQLLDAEGNPIGAEGDRGGRGAPGMPGGSGTATVIPLGSTVAGGKSVTDSILDTQTDILTQIERNTRNTPGPGNPVNVASGQRSGDNNSGGPSPVVASNFPTQGAPKVDSRGGYILSDYSITSNSLAT